MARFLRQPRRRCRRRQEERRGRFLEGPQLAGPGQWRTGFGARRQLGPGREACRKEDQGKGRRQRRRPFRRRHPAGDARFGARHHDDPRLPHARPSACQSRPARPCQAAGGLQRAVAGGLRLHRGRLRPPDLHRQGAGARIRDHPADAGDPDAHLLLDARRRVHAHFRSGGEGLDPVPHRGRRTRASPSPRRASGRSCRSWSRPKASSSSSTSSTRAPSASASTAANR